MDATKNSVSAAYLEIAHTDADRIEAGRNTDYEFVLRAIASHTDAGGALDKAFVEQLANERLEISNDRYPTFDTSRRIVSSIVSMYELAQESGMDMAANWRVKSN